MDIINEDIEAYCEAYSTAENSILANLNRETGAKYLHPRMLSGHQQGLLLKMLSHMLKPEYILEIGSYTGYSAICLASGLRSGGRLYTIEINPELEEVIQRYIALSGNSDKIDLIIGEAASVIPGLDYQFDLVFIDADKENYMLYFDIVLDKVRQGGFILADNVLWSGKILNPVSNDKETQAIAAFNAHVVNCPRVETLMLPVRDGISIIRKL